MSSDLRKNALKFIIFLGVVSLFADITYEGARSITGPYLSILGATGAAVGTIVGIGELVGYGFRAISGYISDKTGRYWTLTFIGYAINLLAVPLLAFANNWKVAALLIVAERFGKALRAPARDAMLSYATKHTGRGWGFGLHESLDQIGAVLGPLIITAMLFFNESYKVAFAALSIPALLALITLYLAQRSFPNPRKMEAETAPLKTQGLNSKYWVYLLAIGLVAAGYADFALIAYHFQKSSSVPGAWVPFFYAVSMGVGGLAALIMGRLFDKRGIATLAVVTGVSALFAPLVFLGGFYASLIGMVFWGIGMSSQESIMRAVIPLLVPPNKRGSAYGVLNLVFGGFWAVGSAIIGILYDVSIIYVVAFSLLAQLAAIPLFLKLKNY
ncbi:MAG: MFS transporter [Chlamydiales bacterium]|nr:MFS transporter [Chlamydiales bacterium]